MVPRPFPRNQPTDNIYSIIRPVLSFLSTRLSISIISILLTLLWTTLSSSNQVTKTSILVHNLTGLQSTPSGYHSGQKLLVLTPLHQASQYLEEYFYNLGQLNYPKNLISLGFLVSDSTDDTIKKLNKISERLNLNSKLNRYERITILQKDFHFDLSEGARHGFEGQPVRRAFIARARNYLLTSTLKEDISWVLWLDVDVVRYDPDVVMDLMSVNQDIAVPNTLWYQENSWDFWGFDRNNFAETEESLALLKKLGPDVLLVEGYRELATHRTHLVDMPTHLGLAHVPLDGIGCTFTLVKAHVHREGVTFPTYTFDNQIETEGLAKVAKKAGFDVVGIPGLLVFHAQNH